MIFFRFLTKTNKVPKWGERWMSGFIRRVPLVEESYVDRYFLTLLLKMAHVIIIQYMLYKLFNLNNK